LIQINKNWKLLLLLLLFLSVLLSSFLLYQCV